MDLPPIPDPGTLEGRAVQLEPLAHSHAGALLAAQAESRASYAFTWVPANEEEMHAYIETALRWRDEGHAFPFATIDRAAGRVAGTTRFAHLRRYEWREGTPLNRGGGLPDDVEIGWTWLAASAQRTHLNTEAKYLMLRHAFEAWKVHAVRLKTDARNARSRAAIERLGGHLDGVLRAERAATDGTLRDTACYSLLEAEWPAARAALEARLRQAPTREP